MYCHLCTLNSNQSFKQKIDILVPEAVVDLLRYLREILLG